MVPSVRLELTRPLGQPVLNRSRLPIPTRGRESFVGMAGLEPARSYRPTAPQAAPYANSGTCLQNLLIKVWRTV